MEDATIEVMNEAADLMIDVHNFTKAQAIKEMREFLDSWEFSDD